MIVKIVVNNNNSSNRFKKGLDIVHVTPNFFIKTIYNNKSKLIKIFTTTMNLLTTTTITTS